MMPSMRALEARRLRAEAQGHSATARLFRDVVKLGLLAPTDAADFRRRADASQKLCSDKLAKAREIEAEVAGAREIEAEVAGALRAS